MGSTNPEARAPKGGDKTVLDSDLARVSRPEGATAPCRLGERPIATNTGRDSPTGMGGHQIGKRGPPKGVEETILDSNRAAASRPEGGHCPL